MASAWHHYFCTVGLYFSTAEALHDQCFGDFDGYRAKDGRGVCTA